MYDNNINIRTAATLVKIASVVRNYYSDSLNTGLFEECEPDFCLNIKM